MNLTKHTFILITIVLMLVGCSKEDPVTPSPYDTSLEVYFGEWEFTKTKYSDYWDYVPGPDGTEVVHTQTETVLWSGVGEVSMGRELGELKIRWRTVTSNEVYYASVNSEGQLVCSGECENIDYSDFGGAQNGGQHHITASDYRIDLGWTGGGSTVHAYDIKGVKL